MKLLFRKIRSFIIPVAITLTVVILFHSIFFLGYVPTESMEPTLKTGSLILGLRCCDDLQNGDIIISEGVSVRKLNLKSANGNVKSNATFEVITANSKNGNTKVFVNAISDVELDVSSKNGNAIVELHNISCCNLSTSSMNGSVHNCFHATTGHNTANGEVSSKNGDVKIS